MRNNETRIPISVSLYAEDLEFVEKLRENSGRSRSRQISWIINQFAEKFAYIEKKNKEIEETRSLLDRIIYDLSKPLENKESEMIGLIRRLHSKYMDDAIFSVRAILALQEKRDPIIKANSNIIQFRTG